MSVVTEEKLAELIEDLDVARSVVFVSAVALDNGDTDLELQSATALKCAFETMNGAYSVLLALRIDVAREEDAAGETQS